MEDRKASGKTLLACIIILGVLAIGLSIWFEANRMQREQRATTLQQGTIFATALAIHPFQLVDGNNRTFTNKNLEHRWSLLFFGFTHCPMICPTTLSKLNKMFEILEEIDANRLPQVVFISVDPKRDSPKAIKKYVKSFNKNFIGATGNPKNLNQLTKNLGIMYAKVQKSGEKNYEINHSGMILVINPKGKWAGILTPPFDANVMVNDLMHIQGRKR